MVIVPEEINVLINPAHPDVSSIKALKQRRWLYDARLVYLPNLAIKSATM